MYASNVLLSSGESRGKFPTWLTYGGVPPDGERPAVHIQASGFFGDGYGSRDSLPCLPLAEIEGVPLLFGKPTVERKENCLVVHADIIASAYFLLTRYEEWIRRDVRDEHGRFPGRESLPFRAGFLDRPIVDEYADLLRGWADEMGIDLPPTKRTFSVLLTHDVDTLGQGINLIQPFRSAVSALLGRQSWARAFSTATAGLGLRRDPCNNLDDVIQMDRSLTGRFPAEKCSVVYFFMAGGNSRFDGAYNIHDALAREAMRCVKASGAGIGLHSSYAAGQRPELIAQELRDLQQAAGTSVHQNRHHFLALREPEDIHALAATGIDWDATLGYADVAGFRLGVCRPIPLFDPIERRLVGVEEHPLVVMDCSLDREKYMGLDEEAAFDHIQKLADATARHGGEFVLLWHNTVLATTDTSYHRRLYKNVLAYLGQFIGEHSTSSADFEKLYDLESN